MTPKSMCAIATLVYAGMMITVTSIAKQPIPEYRVKHKNPVQVKIERHIKDPYIAEVISKTKRPYLIAAIKLVESGQAGPYIMGDNGESSGLFQIQRKYHGWLGYGVERQADLCERILEPLIIRHGVVQGVAAYNGSGPKARRYSKRVIELAMKIEKG